MNKMKILTMLLSCFSVAALFACGEEKTNERSSVSTTYNEATENSSNSIKNDNEIYWSTAGNGCGVYIPEPTVEYDWKAWSSYLCVEVNNITEDYFYDYVNKCLERGFDGEVDEAASPSLYLMAYNDERYYLEIFYYEDEESLTIYIAPPNSN